MVNKFFKTLKLTGLFLLLFCFSCVSVKLKKYKKQVSDIQQNRIELFNNTQEWQIFKALWCEFSQQSPVLFFDEKNELCYVYNAENKKLDEQKFSFFNKETDTSFFKLSATKLLTEYEIEALKLLFEARTLFLFNSEKIILNDDCNNKFQNNFLASCDIFEFQIDSISKLNYFSASDKSNIQTINEKIFDVAQNIITITTITKNYQKKIEYGKCNDKNTKQQNIKYFKKDFKKIRGSEKNIYIDKYNLTKQKLADNEYAFLSFEDIINDLMLNPLSRCEILRRTDFFIEFKILWLNLDKIQPINNLYSENDKSKYPEFVSSPEILQKNISRFRNIEFLTTYELKMLEILVQNRINALDDNPQMSDVLKKTVFEFESEVDNFKSFKDAKGRLKDGYEIALEKMHDLSDKIIMLSIIENLKSYTFLRKEIENQPNTDVQQIVFQIESFSEEMLKKSNNEELKTETIELLIKLYEFDASKPVIHKLISYFEM